jgi:hypothetical protein
MDAKQDMAIRGKCFWWSSIILSGLIERTPLLIGCIFLFSAISKLLWPDTITASFRVLGTPQSVARILPFGLAAYELYLGSLLLFANKRLFVPMLALTTLIVFTGYLLFLVALQNPPSCGCVGAIRFFESNKKEAVLGLVRNVTLLLLLAKWLLVRRSNTLQSVP